MVQVQRGKKTPDLRGFLDFPGHPHAEVLEGLWRIAPQHDWVEAFTAVGLRVDERGDENYQLDAHVQKSEGPNRERRAERGSPHVAPVLRAWVLLLDAVHATEQARALLLATPIHLKVACRATCAPFSVPQVVEGHRPIRHLSLKTRITFYN